MNLVIFCLLSVLSMYSAFGENQPGICDLPKNVGPCRAAMTRWHFNGRTGTCEKFIYGGCQGNRNNFKTVRECNKACRTEGNTSEHPVYTDDEIIASIKNELSRRESKHKERENGKKKQVPSTTSTTTSTTTTSTTTTTAEPPLTTDAISSTIADSFDFDDFTSTEMEIPMDEETDIEQAARDEFADDFSAIAQTVKHLHDALYSMDELFDLNNKYDDLSDIIDGIKEKIMALLDEYVYVEDQTNVFISFILQLTEKGDIRRRLAMRFSDFRPRHSQVRVMQQEQIGNNEPKDVAVDTDISEVLMEQFGGDVAAIQQVMERLIAAMNSLHEYSGVEEEDKIELEEMIDGILDEYTLIISDTNALINLIEELYGRVGHHLNE